MSHAETSQNGRLFSTIYRPLTTTIPFFGNRQRLYTKEWIKIKLKHSIVSGRRSCNTD